VGCNVSGPQQWKADSGKTLKEFETANKLFSNKVFQIWYQLGIKELKKSPKPPV